MQINLDPQPSLDTPNVLGRDAFQNVNDMVRSLATLQSGGNRPLGIKNGEFWCRDLDGNGARFQVYRYIEIATLDGVQQLDIPWTIELAQSISISGEARDDIAPSEKAVSDLKNKIYTQFNVLSDTGFPDLNRIIIIPLPKKNDQNGFVSYEGSYTPPANGWMFVYGKVENTWSEVVITTPPTALLQGKMAISSCSYTKGTTISCVMPAIKNNLYYMRIQGSTNPYCSFIYNQIERPPA